MSPAQFIMAERRPKAKYREMRKSATLFKMGERRPIANYKDKRDARWRWRQRRCSKQEDRKCSSSNDTSVDRISMLPDELLSSILSRITLREQTATSILSRRWRYLWTLTTSLDFDGLDSLSNIGGTDCWNKKETRDKVDLAFEKVKLKFFSWVDHVLASLHGGSTIKDFKVYFDLGKKDEGHINKWLRYVLALKVQRLELNLATTFVRPIRDRYAFPDTFFSHIDEEVGSNPYPVHFKQLKTISLNHVGVDGKALEFFLHSCPLLEDLIVSDSTELLSLRVIGPFPSLKRLEISNCQKLNALEICDANLIYFKYSGKVIHFVLWNLPMLAHIAVPKSIIGYMKVNIAKFSSILHQLEIVTVDMQMSNRSFILPVEMSNLKQLEVVVTLRCDQPLLWLADLIQSAPHLQKFALESNRGFPDFPKRELQRMENAYPHLKEVEFVGFSGVPSDIEFVFHLVDNAAAMKKIIVDTKKTFKFLPSHKSCPNHNVIYKAVRHRLEQKLKKRGIKLEFLITPIRFSKVQ